MKKIVDLSNIANGAADEKFNQELQKVLENIADPNTEAKKARKITLTFTLTGNEKRNLANVEVQAKSTLVPAKEVGTELIIDYDQDGSVTGAELKSGIPGQTYVNDDGEILDDRGKPIEPVKNDKVVSFK